MQRRTVKASGGTMYLVWRQPPGERGCNEIAGIRRHLAGWINEAWGDLTGDPLRAAAGRLSQVAGKARRLKATVHQESARQLRSFLRRNRHWRLQEKS